jgi:hypothetical protein
VSAQTSHEGVVVIRFGGRALLLAPSRMRAFEAVRRRPRRSLTAGTLRSMAHGHDLMTLRNWWLRLGRLPATHCHLTDEDLLAQIAQAVQSGRLVALLTHEVVPKPVAIDLDAAPAPPPTAVPAGPAAPPQRVSGPAPVGLAQPAGPAAGPATPPPAPLRYAPGQTLSVRIGIVIGRAQQSSRIKAEEWKALEGLKSPLNLAIMGTGLGLFVASQAYGGEVIDALIVAYVWVTRRYAGVMGVWMVSKLAYYTIDADCDADLDKAADALIEAIMLLEVTLFLGVIGRAAGRVRSGGAGPGETDTAADPKPLWERAPPKLAQKAATGTSKATSSGAGADESPTPDEEGVSNAEGKTTDPAIIAQRQATARSFYEQAGWTEPRISNHMAGIDFTQPVEVVTLKADTPLVQYVLPGAKQGNYFAAPGTPAETLGINPAGRTPVPFSPAGDTVVLKSTAAPITDTWTDPTTPFDAAGGGVQYFSPNPGAIQAVQ